MRLHRLLIGVVADERLFPDVIRLGKPLFHVAVHLMHGGVDVASVPLVNLRRPFGESLEGIEHRRQLFVLHLDQRKRFFRRFLVDRGNGSHLVADVEDLVFGEHVFVVAGRRNTVLGIGHVLAGDDGENARQGHRLAGVDPLDPTVRDRRAQNLAVHHARQRNISRVKRTSGRLVGRVQARNRCAFTLL